VEKIGTNRRLLDRKILFDWKKPWDILASFVGNSGKPSKNGRQKRPKNFYKSEQRPMWGE